MASVPGFLTKTFEIFSNAEYADCCGWGTTGETIIIRKIENFSKNVLPKYFKHSNFQSFVRQLNMYDFHKTVQDPSHGEFQHTHFKKDRPDLLIYIKRKAHNKPLIEGSTDNVAVLKKDTKVKPFKSTVTTNILVNKSMDIDLNCDKNVTVNNEFIDNSIDTASSIAVDSLKKLSNSNLSKSSLSTSRPYLSSNKLNSDTMNITINGGDVNYTATNFNTTTPMYPTTNSSTDTSTVMNMTHSIDPSLMFAELIQQQATQDAFERRLKELEKQSIRVSGENTLLKRVMMEFGGRQTETQQRLDKLIQVLQSVFTTAGDTLPPSISQTATCLLQDMRSLYQYTTQPITMPSLTDNSMTPLLESVVPFPVGVSVNNGVTIKTEGTMDNIPPINVINGSLVPSLSSSNAAEFNPNTLENKDFSMKLLPPEESLFARQDSLNDTMTSYSLNLPGYELEHQHSFSSFHLFDPLSPVANTTTTTAPTTTTTALDTKSALDMTTMTSDTTYTTGKSYANNPLQKLTTFDRIASDVSWDKTTGTSSSPLTTAAPTSTGSTMHSLAYATTTTPSQSKLNNIVPSSSSSKNSFNSLPVEEHLDYSSLPPEIATRHADEIIAVQTLQRMNTPDYFTMTYGATHTTNTTGSAGNITTNGSFSHLNTSLNTSDLKFEPPVTAINGSSNGIVTGGGELKRMSTIFSSIDDNGLALSRGNSMEVWSMYPPPSFTSTYEPLTSTNPLAMDSNNSSSSSSGTFGRKRERSIELDYIRPSLQPPSEDALMNKQVPFYRNKSRTTSTATNTTSATNLSSTVSMNGSSIPVPVSSSSSSSSSTLAAGEDPTALLQKIQQDQQKQLVRMSTIEKVYNQLETMDFLLASINTPKSVSPRPSETSSVEAESMDYDPNLTAINNTNMNSSINVDTASDDLHHTSTTQNMSTSLPNSLDSAPNNMNSTTDNMIINNID